MRILRLHVTGFGALAGEFVFDPDKLNLVVGPNEAGKSTLAAALTAALYGLDDDGRHYRNRLTPRDQFEPWDGKPYAVELKFEAGGKRFTVNRHFGRGAVTVFEEGRGEVTDEFRAGLGEHAIGEMLLEVNVDQFARSALWLQPGAGRISGAEIRPDEKLSSMLERQASSVSGDASAQSALSVLNGALRQYELDGRRILVGNQIKRLDTELARLRGDLEDTERRVELANDALGELARVREETRRIESERDRTAFELTSLAIAEVESLLERDTQARASVERMRAELAKLAGVPALDADAAARIHKAQAERESAERRLRTLAERRAEEVEGPRRTIESERTRLASFEWAMPVHLQEIDDLVRDIERHERAREQSLEKRASVEEDLAREGVSVEKLQRQRERFRSLSMADTNLLTHYPASAQSANDSRRDADRQAEAERRRLQEIDVERKTRRTSGLALVILGLLAGAGAVWLALQGQVGSSFAGLAVTLGALAAGALFLYRAATHRAGEREESIRAGSAAQRKLQEIKEQMAERELALQDLGLRLGFGTNAELLREHSEYQRLASERERLEWVAQDLERLGREEGELRERAWKWAARARLVPEAATPDPTWGATAALAEVRRGVEARTGLAARLQTIEVQDRRLETEEKEARERAEAALAGAREIVRALGTPEDDWEKALAELEERRALIERKKSLEASLPGAERHVFGARERAAHEQERARLAAERERHLRERPEWAEHRPPAERTRSQAEAARAQLEEKLDRARARTHELEMTVGPLDKEARGRGKASELRVEIERLEAEKRKAGRFRDAVELACRRLEEVARETNARWSEFLSRRVEGMLPHLGPGYRGFQVTDALEYSLEVSGQRLDRARLDQVLSAGTRDQLGLALRLAVCEFLARGGKALPVLLDDPLSTSDDERAAGALRFLATAFAPDHQVFVLTCHRARLDAWQARDPEWFADHVHVVELLRASGNGNGAREGRLASELPILDPDR